MIAGARVSVDGIFVVVSIHYYESRRQTPQLDMISLSVISHLMMRFVARRLINYTHTHIHRYAKYIHGVWPLHFSYV